MGYVAVSVTSVLILRYLSIIAFQLHLQYCSFFLKISFDCGTFDTRCRYIFNAKCIQIL